MYETPDELTALQELLDRSHAGATDHLRGIINAERYGLKNRALVALLGERFVRKYRIATDLLPAIQEACATP